MKEDKITNAYMKMINEQAEGGIESLLGTADSDVTRDLCWLLMHNFELDEDQGYGYALTADVKISGYDCSITAKWNIKEQAWGISFSFNTKNSSSLFKFGDEYTLKTKDVKACLEDAYKQIKAADIDGWMKSRQEEISNRIKEMNKKWEENVGK